MAWAIGQPAVLAQAVERPDDLPGVLARVVGPLLELVEFLDDLERQDDFVVGEGHEGAGIVQEDVRVKDEGLLGHGASFRGKVLPVRGLS